MRNHVEAGRNSAGESGITHLIPSEGWHIARIIEFQDHDKESTAYFVVKFQIDDLKDSDHGIQFTDYFALDPENKWYFNNARRLNLLLHLGGIDFTKAAQSDISAIIGKLVIADIYHYYSKKYNRKQCSVRSYQRAITAEEIKIPRARYEKVDDEVADEEVADEEVPF